MNGEKRQASAIHGLVRWLRKNLARRIFKDFAISLEETTVARELLQDEAMARVMAKAHEVALAGGRVKSIFTDAIAFETRCVSFPR